MFMGGRGLGEPTGLPQRSAKVGALCAVGSGPCLGPFWEFRAFRGSHLDRRRTSPQTPPRNLPNCAPKPPATAEPRAPPPPQLKGFPVIPNGLLWQQHLLLLVASAKLLAEAEAAMTNGGGSGAGCDQRGWVGGTGRDQRGWVGPRGPWSGGCAKLGGSWAELGAGSPIIKHQFGRF